MPFTELPSTYDPVTKYHVYGSNLFGTASLDLITWISPSELDFCRSNALSGDLHDIRKLADYYQFSRKDSVVGISWLAIGVEFGGDSIDIHNLETIEKRVSPFIGSFLLTRFVEAVG